MSQPDLIKNKSHLRTYCRTVWVCTLFNNWDRTLLPGGEVFFSRIKKYWFMNLFTLIYVNKCYVTIHDLFGHAKIIYCIARKLHWYDKAVLFSCCRLTTFRVLAWVYFLFISLLCPLVCFLLSASVLLMIHSNHSRVYKQAQIFQDNLSNPTSYLFYCNDVSPEDLLNQKCCIHPLEARLHIFTSEAVLTLLNNGTE